MNFGIKRIFNFSSSRVVNTFIQIIFVFILYFGADFIGSKVAIDKIYTLPIWFPAGFFFAASIIMGYKILPSLFIGILLSTSVVLTYNLDSLSFLDFSFIAIFISLGETLEIIIGIFLIKKRIKENIFFNHPSYFARFILIALLMSIVGASIGSTVLSLVYPGTAGIFSTIWLTWLISHLTAYVVITPLILSLRAESFVKWKNKTIIESIVFIITLIVLSQIVFGEEIPNVVIFSTPYLVIPLLLWVVIKFSHREVAISLVVLAAFAILHTVRGNGPFYNGDLERSILSLQGYILIVSVSTLLLYSAISELRSTEKELRSYKDNLEIKVAERAEEIKQNNIKLRQEIEVRIKTEKKLRELSEAVEQSPAAVIITDKDGNIKYANPKFIQMKGYSYEEIIGTNPRYFKSGVHDEKFYKNLWGTITSGKIWQGEILNKRRNGETYWELALISPIFNEEGEIYRFVGIYEDISKQKEAEDEIQNYIDKLTESEFRLQELNHNKDRFFSIIAHDLKGPFSSLLGFSEFLVKDFEELTLNEIKAYSININESTKNTYKLLENLLEWARVQRNVIELDFQNFNLYDKIIKVIELYSLEATKKNISLEVKIDKNTIVYADKNTILTVVRNLLSNAIKFCKDGDVILIFSIKKNNNIEISVSDSGVGMAEADVAKLFRIDTHYTNIGTAQERGTGLGLILCKELLEKNNGSIKVQSVLGEGTTFTFSLPEGTKT